jgi:hypothetical protein
MFARILEAQYAERMPRKEWLDCDAIYASREIDSCHDVRNRRKSGQLDGMSGVVEAQEINRGCLESGNRLVMDHRGYGGREKVVYEHAWWSWKLSEAGAGLQGLISASSRSFSRGPHWHGPPLATFVSVGVAVDDDVGRVAEANGVGTGSPRN